MTAHAKSDEMQRADSSQGPIRLVQDAVRPLLSWRSPVPPMLAGIGATLVAIAVLTLPARPGASDQTKTPLFSPQEVLAVVAHGIHSSDGAAYVVEHGSVRFDDGTWYISVGGALFRFSQRNQIVVPDNDEAVQLEYTGAP